MNRHGLPQYQHPYRISEDVTLMSEDNLRAGFLEISALCQALDLPIGRLWFVLSDDDYCHSVTALCDAIMDMRAWMRDQRPRSQMAMR